MPTFTIPAPLEAAIQQAGAAYGVPGDILQGIWYIESGGSYPDNAVNSAGYGGLFGTTDYADTPQGQANFAASILQHLYARYGTWADTLYHYSGGAYTHVPDQTTTDTGGTVDDISLLDQSVEAARIAILSGENVIADFPANLQPHLLNTPNLKALAQRVEDVMQVLAAQNTVLAAIQAKLGA